MLINLHVENLALIKKVDVDFANGLIVLTGETGAGKSLILGSVNIALGNKVSKDIIRTNEKYALVELTFSVSEKCAEIVRNMDIFVDDDNIITVSRKISDVRNVSKINGETVNVKTLKTVMELLVDIHGQHNHQSLLYPQNHLVILDKFAKDEIKNQKEQLKEIYNQYILQKKRLASFDMDQAKRAREIEFAMYEVEEITNADLKENEDIELEEIFRKMSSREEVAKALGEVYQLLNSESNDGAAVIIGRAISAINTIKSDDNAIEQFKSSLYDIETMCSDLTGEIMDYTSEIDYDSEYIKEIEDRLDLINHLKLKYGNSIEDILKYKEEKEKYLLELNNYNQEIDNINNQIKILEEKLEKVSLDISNKRKSAALVLQEKVVEALTDLNFLTVDFKIDFEKNDKYTENGFDKVQFLISTNPGEPLQPLAKVASGGELSRIMLGLKSILANADDIETLIFDEIDTGISGITASRVAEKLATISRHHQVICISHLSQIAAMADLHYLIEKTTDSDSTETNIKQLNREESIKELVRINGDGTVTSAAMNHAIEMKDMADRTKCDLI